MCGRYLITSPVEALRRIFAFDGPPPNPAPRWNAAPTQSLPVVRRRADGTRELAMLRWGLVPSWAKDASIGSRMINARGETVAGKPAYRDALRKRRCLVPADGFYEWPEPQHAEGNDRRPVLFRAADGEPFAFAGLWERWQQPDGGALETFTIVNTEAEPPMTRFHHRVPVVLAAENHARWLDPGADPAPLLRAPPPELLVATRVSTHVNAVRNDDPRCAEPAGATPAEPPAALVAKSAPRGDKRQSSLF